MAASIRSRSTGHIRSAAEMVGRLYANLTVDGRLAYVTAADALSRAVLHLRRTAPIEVWADYLYADA